MRQFLLLMIFSTTQIAFAQNLVLNGSFESYSGCPNNFSQIDSSLYWSVPTEFSSTDYYNECATAASAVSVPLSGVGFQEAHTGSAYGGIYVYWPGIEYREYLQGQLSDTLIEGHCYHFEMYVNLTDYCRLTSDAIGVYFSNSAISGLQDFTPLPVTPQISNVAGNFFGATEWTPVSMQYEASGGETNLLIGNFLNDFATTSVLINDSGLFDFVYVLVDDVSLVPCKATGEIFIENNETRIYPNPATDYVTIETGDKKLATVRIYDCSKRIIIQETFYGRAILSVTDLPAGIYFCEISQPGGIIIEKIVVY